jgi:hypothetical protein
LGYTWVVRSLRERWDWLRDLVARGRAQLALPDRGSRSRADALRDALDRLGLGDAALLEGVAAVLGLSPAALGRPTPAVLGATAGDDLAVVLPLLVEHRSPTIRLAGEAWLAMPETIYAVASDQAERWLIDSAATAELLGPRIAGEGLAWLGPQGLRRVAQHAACASARDAARAWLDRLPREAP